MPIEAPKELEELTSKKESLIETTPKSKDEGILKSTGNDKIDKMNKAKQESGNLGGRPTKMKDFTKAMEIVLNQDINAIILTDEELLIVANDLLEEKAQISQTTFSKWKAKEDKSSKMYQEFIHLYKKALLKQKSELFKKLGDDPQWQRFAWIIERKFSDWNLKQISESKLKHSGEIKGGQVNVYIPSNGKEKTN